MSLDDLQAQLRGALDQQFAALKEQYDQAVAAAREQARLEAEQQAAARIAAARAELETQMSAIVSATRAEAFQQAEQKARAERHALEKELEQQLEQTVQHAVNSVKRSSELELESLRRRLEKDVQAERERGEAALNDAVQAERERAAAALTAERERIEAAAQSERERAASLVEEERARGEAALEQERARLQQAADEQARRASEELEAVKQLLEAEIASAQAEAAAAREEAESAKADATRLAADAATAAAAPVAAPGAAVSLARVPDAVRALDASASLSQLLESLLQHTGAIAGRAALFLIDGDRLKAWKTAAIPEIDVQTVESSIGGRDLLARAIQTGRAMPASETLPAPPFARFSGSEAVAVPLMIGGRAVAVMYADAGGGSAADGWADAVDLLARHASAVAALRAATRTLDVLRGDGHDPAAAPGHGNGEEGARRYARLLVSEIKLYNEAAVRAGREQRDLRQRLRPEIDRALRLYEERVPAAVAARAQYFQQELVQTLADGDSSLLGK